jgi:hypothetical protein
VGRGHPRFQKIWSSHETLKVLVDEEMMNVNSCLYLMGGAVVQGRRRSWVGTRVAFSGVYLRNLLR